MVCIKYYIKIYYVSVTQLWYELHIIPKHRRRNFRISLLVSTWSHFYHTLIKALNQYKKVKHYVNTIIWLKSVWSEVFLLWVTDLDYTVLNRFTQACKYHKPPLSDIFIFIPIAYICDINYNFRCMYMCVCICNTLSPPPSQVGSC